MMLAAKSADDADKALTAVAVYAVGRTIHAVRMHKNQALVLLRWLADSRVPALRLQIFDCFM